MVEFKKIWLLILLCFASKLLVAQNANWLLGTWNGSGLDGNNSQFEKTIVIDSIAGNNFSGTRTNEIKNRRHAKIVTSCSGSIDRELLYIKNVSVISKKESFK